MSNTKTNVTAAYSKLFAELKNIADQIDAPGIKVSIRHANIEITGRADLLNDAWKQLVRAATASDRKFKIVKVRGYKKFSIGVGLHRMAVSAVATPEELRPVLLGCLAGSRSPEFRYHRNTGKAA